MSKTALQGLKLSKYLIAQTNAQVEELLANKEKGDCIEYAENHKDQNDLISEIEHHLNKLKHAVIADDKDRIKEYSADVCNCTLFLMINKKAI
ncbi:hypothetical protein CMU89_17025 [Elizabethkingia anophelis]|nr:hypothetical protein [Elizabethkingia anophelis]MDV3544344.1 hypothetical protein [Elizabethkingia anophelis]